ncbi:hypothetical protein OHC98_26735, partial [Escherichia coli]|nr:hypothetical protein [Escherichia coli]
DLGVWWGIHIGGEDSVIRNSIEPGTNNGTNKPIPGRKNQGRKRKMFFPSAEAAEEQLALAGKNTELAKLKYQTSQGELKTLTEIQKQSA